MKRQPFPGCTWCCSSPRSLPTRGQSAGPALRRVPGSGWSGRLVSTLTTVTSAAPGLDYWEHLDLCVVDELGEVAERWAGTASGRSAPRRTLLYTEAVFQPGDAFVFGPESRGLPGSWLAAPGSLAANPDPARGPQPEPRQPVAIALFEGIRQSVCRTWRSARVVGRFSSSD